jgi:hypothetical protein
MRTPGERYPALRIRKEKGREKRLENEQGGAGGPDVEVIFAGLYFPGEELQLHGARVVACDLCAGNGLRRPDSGQMLRLKPRFFPVPSDIHDPERFPVQAGKSKGRPQDLPAAFPLAPVDFNHA